LSKHSPPIRNVFANSAGRQEAIWLQAPATSTMDRHAWHRHQRFGFGFGETRIRGPNVGRFSRKPIYGLESQSL